MVQNLRKHILSVNSTYESRLIEVEEPKYVFLTAFLTQSFKLYLKQLSIHDFYEKPVQIQTMKEILKNVSLY